MSRICSSLSLEDLINTPVVTASRQSETRSAIAGAHHGDHSRADPARRYRNLADLMEDLPGVDFMRGTKSSAYNNFAMQGYSRQQQATGHARRRARRPSGWRQLSRSRRISRSTRQTGGNSLRPGRCTLRRRCGRRRHQHHHRPSGTDAPGASVTLSGGNFGSREASFTGQHQE
jgi:hypothetical protein